MGVSQGRLVGGSLTPRQRKHRGPGDRAECSPWSWLDKFVHVLVEGGGVGASLIP